MINSKMYKSKLKLCNKIRIQKNLQFKSSNLNKLNIIKAKFTKYLLKK